MSAQIDVAGIAKLFPKAKQLASGEWSACCPMHEDHDPSMSIGLGDDGKLLVHCFAGCNAFTEVVKRAVDAGLMPQSNGHDKTARREVARYIYRDEDGNPLYCAVRYEPKEFKMQRYDAGTWNASRGCMKGCRYVPYRLNEFLATMINPIIIVEGEKDADALWQLDIPATTNVGGAGKWRDFYCQHFRNREVMLIPDNDDAGLRHMRNVGMWLVNQAFIEPLVALLPSGAKDISEWLGQGHKVGDLVPIPFNEWCPPEQSDPEPEETQGRLAALDLDVARTVMRGDVFELHLVGGQIIPLGTAADVLSFRKVRAAIAAATAGPNAVMLKNGLAGRRWVGVAHEIVRVDEVIDLGDQRETTLEMVSLFLFHANFENYRGAAPAWNQLARIKHHLSKGIYNVGLALRSADDGRVAFHVNDMLNWLHSSQHSQTSRAQLCGWLSEAGFEPWTAEAVRTRDETAGLRDDDEKKLLSLKDRLAVRLWRGWPPDVGDA